MSRQAFSPDQVRYLRTLPAVRNVSETRITYDETFRRRATARYLAGDSPTRIFRDAGLDPEIVGHKRIERALARWKQSVDPADDLNDGGDVDAMFIGDFDPKGQLIAKQALRIEMLEHQIAVLKAKLAQMEA